MPKLECEGNMQREGNGEPGPNDGEEPGIRSTIHGHSVASSIHANGPRGYLRGLDNEEAKPLFNYAHMHHTAEFEVRQHGVRENVSLEYKNGKYKITEQGKQDVHTPEKKTRVTDW